MAEEMSIEFTPDELTALRKDPDALRALAAHHEIRATEAASIGDMPGSVRFHDNRSAELRREAARIESEY